MRQKKEACRQDLGVTSLTLWHWLKWAIAVCENGNVPIRFNCTLTESVWAPFWIILAHFNPPADNNLPDTRRLCECNWMYVFQIQSELGKMVKQTGAIWCKWIRVEVVLLLKCDQFSNSIVNYNTLPCINTYFLYLCLSCSCHLSLLKVRSFNCCCHYCWLMVLRAVDWRDSGQRSQISLKYLLFTSGPHLALKPFTLKLHCTFSAACDVIWPGWEISTSHRAKCW